MGLGWTEYLLDKFSVADAYLVTVLNWARATPQIDLAKWPKLDAWMKACWARPAAAKARAMRGA